MQDIVSNLASTESKSEIKKYELEDVISKFKNDFGSKSFFALLESIAPIDLNLYSYSKREHTGSYINWETFDTKVKQPDFGIDEALQCVPKIEVKGSRDDTRLKLFIEHLSYSFLQDRESFKKQYFTSLIIAKTFGVYFSDQLFSQYIFETQSKGIHHIIDVKDLISDFNWAKEFFVGDTKEVVLSKIKKVLIENTVDNLTDLYYSTNNQGYQRHKANIQDLLENNDLDIFDQATKKEIDYQCAKKLIINEKRQRFFAFPERSECKNLEDIFRLYSIDKDQQYNLIMEYVGGEMLRLTENKTSQNKKGNDFTSDIGQ
jgi:hypothetical protein